MRIWKDAKEADLKLLEINAGVQVTLVNGDVKELIFPLPNGKALRVSGAWDSCKVAIQQPPTMVKKYRVTGVLAAADTEVTKDFDSEREAESFSDCLVNPKTEPFEVEA